MINTWIQDLEQSELEAYGRDLDAGIIDNIDLGIEWDGIDLEAYNDLDGDDLCI